MEKGITLIEILVIVALVGLVSGVVILVVNIHKIENSPEALKLEKLHNKLMEYNNFVISTEDLSIIKNYQDLMNKTGTGNRIVRVIKKDYIIVSVEAEVFIKKLEEMKNKK